MTGLSIGLVFSSYRRPVTNTNRELFSRLFTLAQEEGEGFQAGAALVLRAMLQSPYFIYRLESQAGDNPGEGREVDAFELRLPGMPKTSAAGSVGR